MVHDAESGSQHNMTEATGWENILHPLLDILVIGNRVNIYIALGLRRGKTYIPNCIDTFVAIKYTVVIKYSIPDC